MRVALSSLSSFQRWGLILVCLFICSVLPGIFSAAQASTPIDAGYLGFSYPPNTGDDEKPTAEKPESKLWFNDGLWWASLWSTAGNAYYIHQLNTGTQDWVDTGTVIDARLDTKGDALWDGQKLYIVSHVFDKSAQSAPAGQRAELYRYSYDQPSKAYTLDAGFPVEVNQSQTESVVLEKDTTGKLWITYTVSSQVMINHSTVDDLTWATPFVLPVGSIANVTGDDLSSIIAFNGRVGVMWSHQNTPKVFYFAVHVDGDSEQTWQNVIAYGASSDDHINLKALEGDAAGRVFAVVKTSMGSDLNVLLVCDDTPTNCTASSDWSSETVSNAGSSPTRAILLIDADLREIHVFEKITRADSTRDITKKTTSLDNPQFDKTVLGDEFISSGVVDEVINDPSSTKQNVNSATGFAVIASSKTTNDYFHNHIQSGPSAPVANFTADVTSGLVPLTVNFSDISTGMPTSWSWDFGDTGTSMDQHPSHTYTSTGLFTVTLTATNALGGDTNIKTDLVEVFPPGSLVTFTPTDDARVKSTSPTANFGSSDHLRTKSGTYESYLKFNVTGQSGPPASATLRLFITNGSPDGGDVFVVGDGWTESTINFNNAPGITGSAIASTGTVIAGAWVEVDVTSAITGDGDISFGLKSASTNSAIHSSKEGANPPELVVQAATTMPIITSFTPTSGPVSTVVILTGSNFTGATQVDFNGMPDPGFAVDSNTQITATVPAGASTGPINVTTPAGTGSSVTNFTVIVPPVISSFTPASGGIGTVVTITGTGFSGTTQVDFNGTPDPGFVVDSNTQITATVPAGTTTGPINVTNAAGTAASASDFTVIPAPTITGFNPTGGLVSTVVTITGTSFSGATQIDFNGTPDPAFVVDSDTQITATVPAGATTGAINVTTPGGTVASVTDFTIFGTPVISGFTPTDGPVGTVVTINGTNFGGATQVDFNGTPDPGFVVDSDTQITATVPAGAAIGPINVTTPGGTTASATNFTVTVQPGISGFNPGSGPVSTTVTIDGTNFTGATQVDFNGTPDPGFVVDSDIQITATVPFGATTGLINVTNSAGTGTSATDYTVTVQPPTISGFNPGSGPVSTVVTIDGTNFSGATQVDFNGTPDLTFVVDSDIQITAIVPAGATTGPINVTNSAGTGTSASDYTVTVVPPTISDFNPPGGPVGTMVTINGSNFTDATQVDFNGTPDPGFVVVSDGQITATVPAGVSTGPIAVTTPGGTAVSATDFIVTPPGGAITLQEIQTGGSASSSTVATASSITGVAGHLYVAAVAAKNNQTVVSVSGLGLVWSEVTAQCSGRNATGMSVWAAQGSPSGSSMVTATLSGAPANAVIAVARYSGAGGVGNFTSANTNGAAGACSGGTDNAAYSFNLATAENNSVVLAAVAMRNRTHTPGATYIEQVEFNQGSGGGVASVALEDKTVAVASLTPVNGSFNSNVDWAVVAVEIQPPSNQPSISGFNPADGPVGTSVIITGSNFTGATQVDFNSMPDTTFVVDSDTQISATVPAGATTGPISVTTPDGTAVSTANFTVTAIPDVTGFNPVDGPVGTVVTINGTGFTGASQVDFNGAPDSGFVVDSDTQITATVPAGATSGPISVTNSAGTGVSISSFTVTNDPIISGFTPTSGPVTTPVTINGANFTGATQVDFNGTPDPGFTVVNDGEIQTTVPAGAITGPINVITPSGTAASATDFTVEQPPSVTGFTPGSGPVSTLVMITGTNFLGTTQVDFNGTPDPDFVVNSDIQIIAMVPAGTTTGPISVANTAGTGVSASNFTVTTEPVISDFNPGSGPEGIFVTIDGFNFTGATQIDFNGTPDPGFVVDSDVQITAVVPAGATTGPINVATPSGTAGSATDFTVTPPGGGVNLEEIQTGASSSSTMVATTSSVNAVAGHLYVAAVSAKNNQGVVSVSGLGLVWSEVSSQCSGRNATGMSVWTAQGTPGGSGMVTATLAGTPANAIIAVARYSGASGVGNFSSANTNGVAGACSGGIDNAAYGFDLTTTATDAVVLGAVAMRNKTHTPGAGYTEQVEISQGSGGGIASLAFEDLTVNVPSTVSVTGSFNRDVDWAAVAIEIQP